MIIEDLVESGTSMRSLLKVIEEKKNPKDVKTFSLYVKKGRPSLGFDLDYVGFEVPK